MEFSKMRIAAATALAALLIAGGAVAPASAATFDSTVVTISGHVTDRDGKPLAGISALAACPCDSFLVAHQGDEDKTDAKGYYKLRVAKTFADTLYFSDPKDRYFGKAGKLKTVAGGYVSNVKLAATSTISGTITAINGGAARLTSVHFFDAETGKSRGSGSVHADGTYTSHLKPGDYKVKFGGRPYFTERWYGGVATAAESPTVSVGYGGTTTSIDATVTPTPMIEGRITIDGGLPLTAVKERLSFDLLDANGARVGRMGSATGFSFLELAPGTYTLSVAPSAASGDYFAPATQTVVLPADTAVRGLVVNLSSNPATAADTRSTGIEFDKTSKGNATTGKVLKGKIIVSSYGSVAGGKVLIYVNGKKVDSRTLPASGRLNWSKKLGTVVFGKFRVTVRFLGTNTSRPRSEVVYGLYYA